MGNHDQLGGLCCSELLSRQSQSQSRARGLLYSHVFRRVQKSGGVIQNYRVMEYLASDFWQHLADTPS